MASDLKALEARIRDLVGGAVRAASAQHSDWRTRPDAVSDEIIRWVADVVEDENADLRAALARAEETAAQARRNVAEEIAKAVHERFDHLDPAYHEAMIITAKWCEDEARRIGAEPWCCTCGGAVAWWTDDTGQVSRWRHVNQAASYRVGAHRPALAADAAAAPDGGGLGEPDPTRTCPRCGSSWTAEISACPHCQDAHPAACCDLHNRNCEPPSELCCNNCTEAKHYTFPYPHADGSKCVLDTAGSEATDG